MTVRDKAEIGLDPDAGHRKDNVPPEQRESQKEEIEIAERAKEERRQHEPVLIPEEDHRKVP
jgi:hypothetical protein